MHKISEAVSGSILLLLLSIREVFEYKIGCNQLVNNICFICLEDDSLNNC